MKIKVLNTSFEELDTLSGVLSSYTTEQLNSEMIAGAQVILTPSNTNLFLGTNVLEVDEEYYDIVYYNKGQSEDGELAVEVDSEHVSYRLNNPEYDKEYLTELGEPDYILGKILEGTGFTVGTVEFSGHTAYSLQEKMSRRMVLMDFVNYLGGEVVFDKFEVSIVQRRGSLIPKDLIAGRNIQVINKIYNKRETDEQGNPLISYTCRLIYPMDIALGDAVTLSYETLDIDVDLRVVSMTRDPYNKDYKEFEIGNFIPGLEDAARQIEVSSLRKGSKYYGARISPEIGFESVRNDGLARAYFNGDTTAMQKWVNDAWKNILWFNSDDQEFYFDGKVTVDVIEAIGGVIAQYITAEKGYIAELTVDQLDTSDKVQKYLAGDTSTVNYIKIVDQVIEFIHATTDGLTEEQASNRKGQFLFWKSLSHEVITTQDTGIPVMIYVYTELTKAKFGFSISGDEIQIDMGAGTGAGDNGKVKITKDLDSFVLQYTTETGSVRRMTMNESGVSFIPEISGGSGGRMIYDVETLPVDLAPYSDGDLIIITN